MKNYKNIYRTIVSLFIAQVILFLIAPQAIFCQTETLDIVSYTPPKGWTKTYKDGAVVYSDVNKTAGTYCVLTVYASSTANAGSPQQDFAKEWNALVAKQFKVDANPKTESQTNAEGWQGTVGGSQFETEGGLKGIAMLTVFSGFGKTESILAIFNDESYLAVADSFVAGVKLDKTKALAKTTPPVQNNPTPPVQNNPNPADQIDPFPDKPHIQPQKPLVGMLKNSITMADLAGEWEEGGAAVMTVVDSGSSSHLDASFVGIWYAIRPDGTFDYHYEGRTSNQTVRGSKSGTITLSGSHVIMSVTAGESKGIVSKYQFVAYMTLPNGGAVLTLIYLGDNPDRTPTQLYYSCGHANGYIDCGDATWVREKAK